MHFIPSFAMDNFGRTIPFSNFHALSRTFDEKSEETPLRNFQPLFAPNLAFPSQPIPMINHAVGDFTTSGAVGGATGNGANCDEYPNKKPRGRPHGSKNKPKTISTQPIILEIPPGTDIIQSVVQFALNHELYVSILGGLGHVSELDVCYPGTNALPVKISGTFQLVSFTGTFADCASSSSPSVSCFIISIAGSEGHVLGGLVAHRLIAESQVMLLGTSFKNPDICKQPCDSKLTDDQLNPFGEGGSSGATNESLSSNSTDLY